MSVITVIVPLYNKARYIRYCLDSLCAQTLEAITIIVVDDCSTDTGVAIVSEMAACDARIELIEQDHAGPAAARNAGLAAATSEYVAFVDADDWVAPQMYERLHSAALRSDCASARCRYTLERDEAVLDSRSPHQSEPRSGHASKSDGARVVRGGELYARLFAGPDISLMTACTGIYRRETLALHSIRFDELLRHTEDALFNSEVYSLDLPIAVLDEPLYHYRQSGASLSRRHDPDLYRSADRLYECVVALESSHDLTRREVAQAGHPVFIRYLCWYYTIAVANEVTDRGSQPGVFATRAIRMLEQSQMNVVFGRAEREGNLPALPRIVWHLMCKSSFGSLALLLRAFNTARTLRRAIGKQLP